jgi:hypothetical protein
MDEASDGELDPLRDDKEEPTELGGDISYSSSSSSVVALKREVSWSTVLMFKAPYSVSRMCLVACGEIGFGDTIWETERGRPFGMSVARARDSRRDDEECLDEEELECLDDEEDLLEDLCEEEEDFEEDLREEESDGTSRMFKTRPVVGSVVESWAGSWETWYPSMM